MIVAQITFLKTGTEFTVIQKTLNEKILKITISINFHFTMNT